MFRFSRSLRAAGTAAAILCLIPANAVADVSTSTVRLVTNGKGGLVQNPSIDRTGRLIVFQSNADQDAGLNDATETFDSDLTGNHFATGAGPNPLCTNCLGVDSTAGNIFVWRKKKKGAIPANSVEQITFSTTGGFDENDTPSVNARGNIIVWDSRFNPLGANNVDGNREIFMHNLKTGVTSEITVTPTAGVANTTNDAPRIDDRGRKIAFVSRSDFSGFGNCTLTDGVTPCDNADNNAEIMVYDISADTFLQLTQTTGDLGNANITPDISPEGGYVTFASSRDFSGVLPGGVTCSLLGGGACTNASTNEIMLFDLDDNELIQITDTTAGSGCTGAGANTDPTLSKRGLYVTWTSQCEAQLNPSPACGDCNNNEEIFVAEIRRENIVQVTISDAGFNRHPRISGSGRYILFLTERSYLGSNLARERTLFMVKRVNFRERTGLVAIGQLSDDGTLTAGGVLPNPLTSLTAIDQEGGFDASENMAISHNGRFVAYDNSKDVGSENVWFFDRKD